ncbi:RNA-directed DNA polymerase [candidate division KSB1 bacterium]|nr:RNA-directed DNA polymerase [candidate division KSB1 bacterium]
MPSIDHDILKSLIHKRIVCNLTLSLIDTIIDHSNPQVYVFEYFPGDDLFTPFERRRGLPIGNLTSQFFANYYLNPLDHFVKEKLKCQGYIRYVDDCVLFSNSKSELRNWKRNIADFLEHFRLRLHPDRCQIYPVKNSSRFLGQVIFRTHRRLCSKNVRKFKKRIYIWQEYPCENIQQRVASWIGHARQADTFCLLKSLGL